MELGGEETGELEVGDEDCTPDDDARADLLLEPESEPEPVVVCRRYEVPLDVPQVQVDMLIAPDIRYSVLQCGAEEGLGHKCVRQRVNMSDSGKRRANCVPLCGEGLDLTNLTRHPCLVHFRPHRSKCQRESCGWH